LKHSASQNVTSLFFYKKERQGEQENGQYVTQLTQKVNERIQGINVSTPSKQEMNLLAF